MLTGKLRQSAQVKVGDFGMSRFIGEESGACEHQAGVTRLRFIIIVLTISSFQHVIAGTMSHFGTMQGCVHNCSKVGSSRWVYKLAQLQLGCRDTLPYDPTHLVITALMAVVLCTRSVGRAEAGPPHAGRHRHQPVCSAGDHERGSAGTKRIFTRAVSVRNRRCLTNTA